MEGNLNITSQFFVWKFGFKLLSRVKDFCDKNKYSDCEVVYEVKLVRFFQDKVLNRAKKTQRLKPLEFDKDKDGDLQTLKYKFIKRYKTGLINFWSYQVLRSQHSQINPNGNASRSIIKDSSRNQNMKKNLALEYRSCKTIADNYDQLAL